MNQETVRIKIIFTYDGTGFFGWQVQKTSAYTVQQVLQEAFQKITKQKINITASGRTDAGVHARIQVAHADFPKVLALKMLDCAKTKQGYSFPQNKLSMALNSLLPQKIRILDIKKANSKFHSIRDVTKKTYVYFIDPSAVQWPMLSRYTWNLKIPLNWKKMRLAAKKLVGTHDFQSFCASDSSAKTTVRTIDSIKIEKVKIFPLVSDVEVYAIAITGNGFLKQMVRSIVGTLVHIGDGKAEVDLIDKCLFAKNRNIVGKTAPANGLWLWDIRYLTERRIKN